MRLTALRHRTSGTLCCFPANQQAHRRRHRRLAHRLHHRPQRPLRWIARERTQWLLQMGQGASVSPLRLAGTQHRTRRAAWSSTQVPARRAAANRRQIALQCMALPPLTATLQPVNALRRKSAGILRNRWCVVWFLTRRRAVPRVHAPARIYQTSGPGLDPVPGLDQCSALIKIRRTTATAVSTAAVRTVSAPMRFRAAEGPGLDHHHQILSLSLPGRRRRSLRVRRFQAPSVSPRTTRVGSPATYRSPHCSRSMNAWPRALLLSLDRRPHRCVQGTLLQAPNTRFRTP